MLPFLDAGPQVAIAMAILYAVLAAASLSVRLAARGAAPGMLSHQVNAWWRIFPVVSLALLAYPLGLSALAGLVCVLALRELAALRALRRGCRLAPLVLAGLLLATVAAMLVLAAFPALPLGAHASLAWVFYLFVLTALNDIGQFVSGTLFGRHRIAPTISPNKTWQGLAGGIAISQCVSLALGGYLALATAGTLMLYALLLSLAGFMGDLAFSAAKRRLAIKDFSSLIPGHGGILDRVDSLVFTAPLLYCLLRSADQGLS